MIRNRPGTAHCPRRPDWMCIHVPDLACPRGPLTLLAGTVALAAVSALAAAPPVAAAEAGGNGQFGITPAPAGNGIAAPYFMITMPAGGSDAAMAVVTNQGSTTEKLKLGQATGVTAGNGGSAFSRPAPRCTGPGCWVTGLPGTVTLPGHSHIRLPFTVHVPAGTHPGQYLAGLTAQPATRPRAVRLGSTGKGAKVQAVIIRQVTVGVAVTVGSLSQLTTRLRIPTVSGVALGRLPRLNILVRNTGQTFTHALGRASCTAAGKRHSYRVFADTVLPGGHALIPANAPGLPEGTSMPCTVRLRYGAGLTVSWAGQVTIPAPPAGHTVHTGPGAYSVVPPNTIPPWAILLIVIGGLALVLMAMLLVRAHRRGKTT
jgi:hypothetical protein